MNVTMEDLETFFDREITHDVTESDIMSQLSCLSIIGTDFQKLILSLVLLISYETFVTYVDWKIPSFIENLR